MATLLTLAVFVTLFAVQVGKWRPSGLFASFLSTPPPSPPWPGVGWGALVLSSLTVVCQANAQACVLNTAPAPGQGVSFQLVVDVSSSQVSSRGYRQGLFDFCPSSDGLDRPAV